MGRNSGAAAIGWSAVVSRPRDQPQELKNWVRVRPDLDAGNWLRCCGWSSPQTRSVHVASSRVGPAPAPLWGPESNEPVLQFGRGCNWVERGCVPSSGPAAGTQELGSRGPDLDAGNWLRCCGWSSPQTRSVHVASSRVGRAPAPFCGPESNEPVLNAARVFPAAKERIFWLGIRGVRPLRMGRHVMHGQAPSRPVRPVGAGTV